MNTQGRKLALMGVTWLVLFTAAFLAWGFWAFLAIPLLFALGAWIGDRLG